MANYWAITIGINQYRHFQPLMHAQDDALSTHRFFKEEAGIPADRCILLSDLSASIADRAVYPDKPAIAQWVQTISQQIEEGDIVWFFFSGYGVQTEGRDYLMPIDGAPDSVESTGLSAAELIDTLAQLPTDNVLLILDINRSQGALADQTIGTEIIELAEKRAVTTFLSCQPEQYSHETIGVRHGLFTAALLEAVHQARKTPEQISDYLNKRLPELCDHHWRPIQNPVVVIAESKARSVFVPEVQSTLTTSVKAASVEATNVKAISDESYEDSYTARSDASSELAVGAAAASGAGTTALAIESSSDLKLSSDGDTQPTLVQPPYTEEVIAAGSYQSSVSGGEHYKGAVDTTLPRDPRRGTLEEESMAVTGAKLRNWGLLALALLMGGVLLKQPFVQTAWQGLSESIGRRDSEAEESSAKESNTEENRTEDASAENNSANDAVVLADDDANAKTTVNESEAPAVSSESESNEPETAISPTQADSDSSATSPGTGNEDQTDAASEASTETAEAEKAAAEALIAQANVAIEQRQYSEALIALQEVPRSQRDSNFSAVLAKARTGSAEAQQTNASVLTEARTSIQPTQASQFTEAIAKARLIKPGEPYYEAAQRDIRSWSQVILDIAEGRATSGNLDGAIAAASVMPRDNAEFYQKSQDRIAFWQQRQNSRKTIAEAQTIPKLGQASTYQKGIVKLREVPIEHPEYETAQRLADQWSQSIFSIAQARAAQGRQNAAIQAAILVPAGTTAYEPTQQAIRRWKAGE